MKQTIGYTRFSMSYNDMAIINMAIMKNIYWKGDKIEMQNSAHRELKFKCTPFQTI